MVSQLDTSPPGSIDYPTLENLFGQEDVKKNPEDAIDCKKSTSKPLKDSTLSFLDSKKSMNLNITLRAFKTDPLGVATLINDCAAEKMDLDHLRSLLKVLPEKDEVCKYIYMCYTHCQILTFGS